MILRLPPRASLFGLAALICATLHAEPSAGYRLVWSDEFDGCELNTHAWNTTMAFAGARGPRQHNPSYLNYVLDEDTTVADGALRIRAERHRVIGDNPPGVWDYSGGFVASHDKVFFTYGYIEIRARFPAGPGVWPAFWMMPQDQTWPPEFDVAEYYSSTRVMHLGLCHGTLDQVRWDSTGDTASRAEEGWHTYALEWSPGRAVWLQDGVRKKVVEADYVPAVPMYLVFNNGVSGPLGPTGSPDATTPFPNFFEIDYVRVYQRELSKPTLETKAEGWDAVWVAWLAMIGRL